MSFETIILLGSLSKYYGDGNENVTKQLDIIRKIMALYVRYKFWCICSPSSAKLPLKCPNSKFSGELGERMSFSLASSLPKGPTDLTAKARRQCLTLRN